MNKAILMSIQPKWLVKILNGDKTIDIRKSMPKCELPIDVYLYCTKDKKYLHHDHMFLTDNDRLFLSSKIELPRGFILNGKVVAKFTLNKVDDCCDMSATELELKSKLSITEICGYIKAEEVEPKMVYAWHIDNLVIFDKPMDLGDFYKIDVKKELPNDFYLRDVFSIKQAPQSWQYAYVEDEV